MILTRTPLRISFAGGGSDLPEFYRQQGGAVLAAAINRYMYLTVNPKFDACVRVSYSKTENVARVDDLEHDLARETLKEFDIAGGIEVVSVADVPAGTGLGSSSAYAVGLIAALSKLKRQAPTTRALAGLAAEIEIARCKRQIGIQDHFASAYGGLRLYEFSSHNTRVHEPVEASRAQFLWQHLMLFYLGGTHDAGEIHRGTVKDEAWRKDTARLAEYALSMHSALRHGDIATFGTMLGETWQLKRKYASTDRIDALYDRARGAGAWGGKVCGAGGGGFLLVCAPTEKHAAVRAALNLRALEFAFADKGAEVLYAS